LNHDAITELLKNYRSYRYAVSNGVASWDRYDNTGMPMNGAYGSRVPRLTGGSTLPSVLDYQRYSRIVQMVDGAVNEVLDDNQRTVIMRKYLDRNRTTLSQIASDSDKDERTIRRWHKEAISLLLTALKFVEVPEIINLDELVKSA
jgi:hypothetical protein